MRNKLTELTDLIDDHNAALGVKIAELQTLLLNRTSIIEKGREIGLRPTAVAKMLSSVKLRFIQAEQGPDYQPEPSNNDSPTLKLVTAASSLAEGTVSGETLIAMGYGDD